MNRDFRRRQYFQVQDKDVDGFVYFARGTVSGLIKIGASVQPGDRLGQLEGQFGERFEGLGILPGYGQLEAVLHRKFWRLAAGRELFKPDRALLAYIERDTLPWDSHRAIKAARALVKQAFEKAYISVSGGICMNLPEGAWPQASAKGAKRRPAMPAAGEGSAE